MQTHKIKFALLLMLSCFMGANAQNPFEVIEEPLPYSKMASSFTINIIGYNEDFVMTEWQKYITDFSGVTYLTSINKGVIDMESKGVVFPLLNNEKVTLHTRFSPNSSLTGVLLTVWIEKEDGSFFSSSTNKKEAQQIKDWLFEFQKKIRLLNTRIKHKE
tara:strand:- start:2818 stop:3297 length:480 start_codon:yes stop_codon:yes gene_type:complete